MEQEMRPRALIVGLLVGLLAVLRGAAAVINVGDISK